MWNVDCGMWNSIPYRTFLNWFDMTFDTFVKSLISRFFVIPAKAGIQFFQLFINSLGTGSCRRTGVTFLRDHDI